MNGAKKIIRWRGSPFTGRTRVCVHLKVSDSGYSNWHSGESADLKIHDTMKIKVGQPGLSGNFFFYLCASVFGHTALPTPLSLSSSLAARESSKACAAQPASSSTRPASHGVLKKEGRKRSVKNLILVGPGCEMWKGYTWLRPRLFFWEPFTPRDDPKNNPGPFLTVKGVWSLVECKIVLGPTWDLGVEEVEYI